MQLLKLICYNISYIIRIVICINKLYTHSKYLNKKKTKKFIKYLHYSYIHLINLEVLA